MFVTKKAHDAALSDAQSANDYLSATVDSLRKDNSILSDRNAQLARREKEALADLSRTALELAALKDKRAKSNANLAAAKARRKLAAAEREAV